MKKKTIEIITIIIFAVVIGALVTIAYLVFPKNLEQLAPSKIDSFQRAETLTGSSAISASKSSHLGKLKKPQDAAIIAYHNRTGIWISSYSEEKDAQRETERMAKAMKHFSGGFEKLEKVKVNGTSIFCTHPKGHTHYFWQYKTMMVYIAPGTLSQKEVEDLIKEINFKITLHLLLD